MERKLVKQGRNALTVTLPSKWLKKYNLTHNNVVEVEEIEEYLQIRTKNNLKLHKSITLNLENSKTGFIFHKLIGKYVEGYDKIELFHNGDLIFHSFDINFFGMIITENDSKKLVLENLISTPNDTFFNIFKRSFQLLISQSRMLNLRIDNSISPQEVRNQEKILDSNIFYLLRHISKYENNQNSYKYFLLTSTLEGIGDLISEISKYLDEIEQISKDDIKNIHLIIENIEQYMIFLFSNKTNEMFSQLQEFKSNLYKHSYIGGITFAIREQLSNYLGYLSEN